MYDYLIVGSGLFGAIFAYEATKKGKKCLVVEKRNHIGGNCYTKQENGINIHLYGAHIFRTSDKEIWDYMQQFCTFNHFINSPIANYKGEIYNDFSNISEIMGRGIEVEFNGDKFFVGSQLKENLENISINQKQIEL